MSFFFPSVTNSSSGIRQKILIDIAECQGGEGDFKGKIGSLLLLLPLFPHPIPIPGTPFLLSFTGAADLGVRKGHMGEHSWPRACSWGEKRTYMKTEPKPPGVLFVFSGERLLLKDIVHSYKCLFLVNKFSNIYIRQIVSGPSVVKYNSLKDNNNKISYSSNV